MTRLKTTESVRAVHDPKLRKRLKRDRAKQARQNQKRGAENARNLRGYAD